MKKLLILFLLVFIVFSMASCGGSGSGSSSSPPGEDPDVPFLIELRPSQSIAQTNTFIYIRARVLNGNGNPIPNIPVYFTNISPIGTFDVNPPVVNTDQYGYATVKLLSTTEGFATIQAEVNTGSGQVMERKTVFFSVFDLLLLPFMDLDVVDGELDYYTLFESPTDNQVLIRATVFNRFGQIVPGSTVTFGADWPYKVGSSTTCSDNSSTCEVWFPSGNTATTDGDGEAFVLVRVDPVTIRNVITILNITASADNGAAGMVTLFLEPVVVSSVTVSADPTSVETGGTSTITAAVTLNTGNPAFDGTTVSFTTTQGSITPFAQTTDGATTGVTFTAPEVTADTTATITASVGGKSDSVVVTITAPVIPPPPTPPTPDFTLSCNQATLTISASSSGLTVCRITSVNSYSAPVTLACLGLPGASTCTFNPVSPVTPPAGLSTDVTVTVNVGAVAPNTYPFVFQGSGGATHTVPLTLIVP